MRAVRKNLNQYIVHANTYITGTHAYGVQDTVAAGWEGSGILRSMSRIPTLSFVSDFSIVHANFCVEEDTDGEHNNNALAKHRVANEACLDARGEETMAASRAHGV